MEERPMSIKVALLGVLGFCATALGVAPALAQNYPNAPVKILVASAAGGSLDVLARVVGQGLAENLGQPFIVEAKPGAGGNLAIEAMLKEKPDGYTLLFSGVGVASNPSLYRPSPYEISDLAAISLVGEAPLLIMATPSLPANTVPELIKLVKSKPGTVRSAILSGGSSQFACDMFRMMAGIGADMPNVPYKGGTQIFTDVIGGHVEVAVLPLPESLPHVKDKRVKAIAQTGSKRSPLAPDIPTVEEAGIKGYSMTAWYMVTGPAKMPREIVTRLNQEITKVLKQPATQQKFAALGIDIIGSDVDHAASFLKTEQDKFAQVVKFSGAKVE
jgi:tripartite-type tricarboxylate transporter receptor subunit TctC